MNVAPVITLDGPSATGKGTIAALVAEKLGFHLLDSGSLYRMLAIAAHDRGIDPDDGPAIAALAPRLQLESGLDNRIRRSGNDASTAIRTSLADELASRISALPEVRTALLSWQQQCRREPGLVAEGRDMGSVVFRDAESKFFLTASAEIRANRRHKQLIDKGLDAKLPDLLRDLQARDRRDEQRKISPLRPASGAIVIDTSDLGIDQVVGQVMESIAARRGG